MRRGLIIALTTLLVAACAQLGEVPIFRAQPTPRIRPSRPSHIQQQRRAQKPLR